MPVSHPFCCLSNKSTNKALCLSLTKICEVGEKMKEVYLPPISSYSQLEVLLGLILQNSCMRKQRIWSSSYMTNTYILFFPNIFHHFLHIQYSFLSLNFFFSYLLATWLFLLPGSFYLTRYTCFLKIYLNTDSFIYSSDSRQQ